MKLHLVDINPLVVRAWRRYFERFPEVDVQVSDILAVAFHCIVSPANSHGFMDGGIDLAYRNFFGAQIEETVQESILRRPDGSLPVGASIVVRTGHDSIPYMIVAPTMEMPEAVPPQNCSRAMRAILRAIDHTPEIDGDIFCPGLGTLIGRVDPEEAAREMADAYGEWIRTHTQSNS